MNISSIPLEALNSIKQALSISNMRKAMNQDAQTMSALLNDMQESSAKIMESSVTPHKGGNIDISI